MTTNSRDPDLWVTTILGRYEPVILDGKVVGTSVVTQDNHVIAVVPANASLKPVQEFIDMLFPVREQPS